MKKKNEDWKRAITLFQEAHYPRGDAHMSFKKSIETITGNPRAKVKLKDEKAFIKIGGRQFEILEIFAPCYRTTNAFLFDASAHIVVGREQYIIDFILDNDTQIFRIDILEEDKNGYLDYSYLGEKKYRHIDSISPGPKENYDRKSLCDYIK